MVLAVTDQYSIAIMFEDCERCGKFADRLYPFQLADTITYRRKVIEYPWLCGPCHMKEKEKWWKGKR